MINVSAMMMQRVNTHRDGVYLPGGGGTTSTSGPRTDLQNHRQAFFVRCCKQSVIKIV